MEENVIFTGYKQFKSKKGNDCNVLTFITQPKKGFDGKSVFVNDISIFLDSVEAYNKFITEHKLLSTVPVKVTVNGDKAYYNL